MKYAGAIGFVDTNEATETSPGVHVPTVTERRYRGDIIRRSMRWQDANQRNRNVNVSNQISIVADPYAFNNIGIMAYATWLGQKWKIISAEVQYPRITLTIGDLYNEDQPIGVA
jgi:hypothetical protein